MKRIHNLLSSTSIYNGIITIFICVIIHILFTCNISFSKMHPRDVNVIQVAFQNGFIDGIKYMMELDTDLNEGINKHGGLTKENKTIIDRMTAETKNYIKMVVKLSGGIATDTNTTTKNNL